MANSVIRTAAKVLRMRPALLAFPALGLAVYAAVLAGALALPLHGAWQRLRTGGSPTDGQQAALVVVLALLACVNTCVSASLQHSVHHLLDGRRLPLRASLAAAGRRLPVLAAWTLLGTALGGVLRVLENTAGVSVLFDLFGLSWSLLTFFAVPVLVLEGTGLLAGLRRSLTLGRRQLGTWVSGGIRVWLTTAAVAMAAIAALILAVETDDKAVMAAVAAAVVLVVLLTGLAQSAASGIYRVALYRRAVAAD